MDTEVIVSVWSYRDAIEYNYRKYASIYYFQKESAVRLGNHN